MTEQSSIPARSTVSVVVEPMTRRHLKAVRGIDALSYPSPWSTAMYLQELANSATRVYRIVRVEGTIAGYGGLMKVGPDGHVTSVATHPSYRSRGVATRAMLGLCRGALDLGCEAMTLEVRVSNSRASSLYERFGFEVAGVRKGYYSDNGEDAAIMWLNDIDTASFRAKLRDIEAALTGVTDWRSI